MEYGVPLRVIYGRNEEHEAERVVAEIVRRRFLERTPYHHFAILYRGNHQSRVFEKALLANRIPYRMTGGQSFFARAEVKDVMAYLRLVVNPSDDTALIRIINTPKRGIGPQTVERIGELAHELHISLLDAAAYAAVKTALETRGYQSTTNSVDSIQGLARRCEHPDQVKADLDRTN